MTLSTIILFDTAKDAHIAALFIAICALSAIHMFAWAPDDGEHWLKAASVVLLFGSVIMSVFAIGALIIHSL